MAAVRKYVRVADALRARISRGEYQPGDMLPSTAELQHEFEVSDTVINQARGLLIAEGVLIGRPGAGTYVSERPSPRKLHLTPQPARGTGSPFRAQQEAEGREATWESDTESTTASPLIAERLGISVGDRVMRTRYRYLADAEPVQLATSHEPYTVVGRTPAVLPEEGPLAGLGVVDRMDAIGIRVTRQTREFTSRPATDAEARALGGVAGNIVTAIIRTYWADHQAVETAEIVVLADRYSFVLEMPVD